MKKIESKIFSFVNVFLNFDLGDIWSLSYLYVFQIRVIFFIFFCTQYGLFQEKDFTSGRGHFSHVLNIVIEWRKNRLKIKIKTFPETII